jgi:acetyl/propionyl-CoA carboxylase alpha subunit
VEHTVTEEITGQDLVAWQIAVAEGRPLPLTQEQVVLSGHAIEVRVYAEDPQRNYLPSTGTLLRVELGDDVRVESGMSHGDTVGIHYDAMLAKIVVVGEDRRSACRRLRRALSQAWLPGLVSNLPLLRDIASDEAWLSGDTDTGFLERRGLPLPLPLQLETGVQICAALAWWSRRAERSIAGTPAGWRIGGPVEAFDRWASAGQEFLVGTTDHGEHLQVRVGESPPVSVTVLAADAGRARVRVGHVVRKVRWVRDQGEGPIEDGTTLFVHLGDGEALATLVPRFAPPQGVEEAPGSCVAATPGMVRKVYVQVGDVVDRGDALVVLEAMKVEQTLTASSAGTVEAVLVEEGEAVQQGMLLVRLLAEG